MSTQTITQPQQLVGSRVTPDPAADCYTEQELEELAHSLGFQSAQVRTPEAMYDCVFDETRLLVFVDSSGRVVRVTAG
ncbi:MAG: hypothetical protein JSS66_07575 [Armatimonadetes bacterium]|nr:hypothetical protein [Armatimonadota bacterium]